MRTVRFVCMVVLAGALAGILYGLVNLALVEPYLDAAISIENQNLFEAGVERDTPEFWSGYESYRTWQKGGQVLASTILGMAWGSMFGIVFALSRGGLPGKSNASKSLILAGIMWTVLVLLPLLKYPANPPTVGETETVAYRTILYVSLVAISGFGALASHRIYRMCKRPAAALASYAAIMVAAFVFMPANPDPVTAPAHLVDGFRAGSMAGSAAFWAAIGAMMGLFWDRFKLASVQGGPSPSNNYENI